MRGSFNAMTSCFVRSFDASSTTMTSSFGPSCFRTESSCSLINTSPLHVAKQTEILGSTKSARFRSSLRGKGALPTARASTAQSAVFREWNKGRLSARAVFLRNSKMPNLLAQDASTKPQHGGFSKRQNSRPVCYQRLSHSKHFEGNSCRRLYRHRECLI